MKTLPLRELIRELRQIGMNADMERQKLIQNPYRPGAGHLPPFLGGRLEELRSFKRIVSHLPITENVLVTGLRGVGKTVLIQHMQQLAERSRWLWVGNDLSESSALTEDRLALRILTDLSIAITRKLDEGQQIGSSTPDRHAEKLHRLHEADGDTLTFDALKSLYERSPGLPSDRLKVVLRKATAFVKMAELCGLVLAYDEAQCLSDHADTNEFPMSMLVETVGALQKSEGLAPCLLVLSGLPHVFDALTATRTYTERMFHVMTLDRLSWDDTRAALLTPLTNLMPPLRASEALLAKAVELTGGYPYLIQFFGKELVEQILENGGTLAIDQFPSTATLDRLDSGLFAARWNRTTDRQREFLGLIARRGNNFSTDFAAAEVLHGQEGAAEFGPATANQMLLALVDKGLIYRTRHGRYAFTVPMSEVMILRRIHREQEAADGWQPIKPKNSSPPIQDACVAEPPRAQKKRRSWFG